MDIQGIRTGVCFSKYRVQIEPVRLSIKTTYLAAAMREGYADDLPPFAVCSEAASLPYAVMA